MTEIKNKKTETVGILLDTRTDRKGREVFVVLVDNFSGYMDHAVRKWLAINCEVQK